MYSYNVINKYRTELMGIAAFIVFLDHSKNFSWSRFVILSKIFAEGGSGVDIFLILSGVGLYYSFTKNGNLKDFYRKRFLRIIPVYLIITVPEYSWSFIQNNQTVFTLLSKITTISYWIDGSSFWYISFILIFYFLYPLIYKYVIHNNAVFYVLFATSILLQFVLMNCAYDYYGMTELAFVRIPITLAACKLGQWTYKEYELKKGFVWICLLLGVIIRAFRIVWVPVESAVLVAMLVKLGNMFLMIAFCYIYSIVRQWIDEKCVGKTALTVKNGYVAAFEYMGVRSLEMYLVHLSLCGFVLARNPGCDVLYYWIVILPVTLVLIQIFKMIDRKIQGIW